MEGELYLNGIFEVDTYRLQRQRIPEERRARSREDSLLDETSGST